MEYTADIILNINHVLDKDAFETITPNELRAAADDLACQMEAVELELWKKSSILHWTEVSELSEKDAWNGSIRYTKRFVSQAAFHEELDLLERNGFNRNKASLFLTSNEPGEGVSWKWNA